MAPAFKTIDRPPSLSDRVYATLRNSIRSGQFRGQPVQEALIAAELGVSRTPVREVFARLVSEGLIQQEGRGYIVPRLSRRDIEDIYELRLMVEPQVLRKIASTVIERSHVQQLRAELAAMVAAHEMRDAAAFIEANYRYREIWLRLVPNARLLRVMEQYSDHVRSLRAITLNDPATRKTVINGLRAVTSALAVGDGNAAANAMRAHLEGALRALHAAIGNAKQETVGYDPSR
jgi:DNA-binding GntR family transcriptional regulator